MADSSNEHTSGSQQLPDFEIAPLAPRDAEMDNGAVQRLALWKAQEVAASQVWGEPGETQIATPMTLEQRIDYQYRLYQARLRNLDEGIAQHPSLEEVSQRYGVPTSGEMVDTHVAWLEGALARSTPDEQEDLLIMENRDWRAWIAKYGEQDIERHLNDLRRARVDMMVRADAALYAERLSFSYRDIPPELTPEEGRLDYWRWLATSFGMNSSDLSDGIAEGLITDAIVLRLLDEYRDREA
jgi:hypothetical protein